MDTYKIIEVKESVFADNDREAARLRQDEALLAQLIESEKRLKK